MSKDIATFSRTREIMEKHGLFTKKGYGQNFITDANTVRKIAQECHLDDESAVIEIGPGLGALTEQLARIAKRVVAYEIDERLLEVLQDSLAAYDTVEVIHQDFLTVDFQAVVEALLEACKEVVVAANLPYYITTPILFHMFESNSRVDRIVVMMQKEVANRFAAKVNTKDYNALSVMTQYLWDVRIVMRVSRNVFEPKPNVDSAVVEFKRKDVIPLQRQDAFFTMIKSCFEQRRKTICNNLAVSNGKEKALYYLKKSGIAPKIRAESLELADFMRLFQVMEEK